ncbi:MAG: sulfatase [Candidatus Solibacter usitatus]|nr:sulfatase [Candidatus Solibacter usitatus]
MLNRRQALGTLSIAGLAQEASRPPNFVLINCDDMGYADIQPYRNEVDYTPHLARMAREGMKFTSWYAAPVCSPSRSALMTGCYPKRVGLSFGSWHVVLMPGDWHGLNPKEITVAKLLQSKGYATACIGKWHLGDQPEFLPTRHGFDYYFGLPYSNDMRPSPKPAGIADHPHPPLPLLRNDELVREVTDQDFLTGAYTEEALKFIEANKSRPFFLYLPHSMVHAPLAAGKAWRGKTGKGLYEDSVAEVDWSTGEILKKLESLNLAKNTLVIFISDNGGTPRAVNAPLRGNKGQTWEGGMRVPAIAWWPGRVPAGRVFHEITSNMDILPTFAKLAGTTPPADRKIDGHDLSAVLEGKPGATSGYDAFFYYHANELRGVRSGKWKLTANGELYDLDKDLAEGNNVVAFNADVVKRLNTKLAEARADLGDKEIEGKGCHPVGKAKGPLRFWIPRHPDSGHPPQAPVKYVPGSPVR